MPLVYCGTRLPIPLDYFRRGTPYECLRKGVGVGKYLVPRAAHPPLNFYNNLQNNDLYVYIQHLLWPIMFILIIWIMILLFLVFL
jgi:hypothetical protein